jgi:hypothetical protein
LFLAGRRTPFSELDFAVLGDIGYAIRAPEEVRLAGMARNGNDIAVSWMGGVGPFALESKADLNSGDWVRRTDPLPAAELATVTTAGGIEFFRVADLGR